MMPDVYSLNGIKCPSEGCVYNAANEEKFILHARSHYKYETFDSQSKEKSKSKEIKISWKNGVYCCASCNSEVTDRLLFREHVRHHLVPRPYKCGICLKAVSSVPQLRQHFNKMHKDSNFELTLVINNDGDIPNQMERIMAKLRVDSTDRNITTNERVVASDTSGQELLATTQNVETTRCPAIASTVNSLQSSSHSNQLASSGIGKFAFANGRFRCFSCNYESTRVSLFKSHVHSHVHGVNSTPICCHSKGGKCAVVTVLLKMLKSLAVPVTNDYASSYESVGSVLSTQQNDFNRFNDTAVVNTDIPWSFPPNKHGHGNSIVRNGDTTVTKTANSIFSVPNVPNSGSINPSIRDTNVPVSPVQNLPDVSDMVEITYDSEPLQKKCKRCSFTCNSMKPLSKHYGTCGKPVKAAENYVCSECKFTTTKKDVFVWHMVHHTNVGTISFFSCSVCKAESSWRQFIVDHIATAHPDTSLSAKEKPACKITIHSETFRYLENILKCPECKNGLAWRRPVVLHNTLSHRNEFLAHLFKVHKLSAVADYIKTNYNCERQSAPTSIKFPHRLMQLEASLGGTNSRPQLNSSSETVNIVLSKKPLGASSSSSSCEEASFSSAVSVEVLRFHCDLCDFSAAEELSLKSHVCNGGCSVGESLAMLHAELTGSDNLPTCIQEQVDNDPGVVNKSEQQLDAVLDAVPSKNLMDAAVAKLYKEMNLANNSMQHQLTTVDNDRVNEGELDEHKMFIISNITSLTTVSEDAQLPSIATDIDVIEALAAPRSCSPQEQFGPLDTTVMCTSSPHGLNASSIHMAFTHEVQPAESHSQLLNLPQSLSVPPESITPSELNSLRASSALVGTHVMASLGMLSLEAPLLTPGTKFLQSSDAHSLITSQIISNKSSNELASPLVSLSESPPVTASLSDASPLSSAQIQSQRIHTATPQRVGLADNNSSLKCDMCVYFGSANLALEQHKKDHQKYTTLVHGYRCSICEKLKYPTIAPVKIHVNRFHESDAGAQILTINGSVIVKINTTGQTEKTDHGVKSVGGTIIQSAEQREMAIMAHDRDYRTMIGFKRNKSCPSKVASQKKVWRPKEVIEETRTNYSPLSDTKSYSYAKYSEPELETRGNTVAVSKSLLFESRSASSGLSFSLYKPTDRNILSASGNLAQTKMQGAIADIAKDNVIPSQIASTCAVTTSNPKLNEHVATTSTQSIAIEQSLILTSSVQLIDEDQVGCEKSADRDHSVRSKKYTCAYCLNYSPTKSLLQTQNHILCIHAKRYLYKCPECEYGTSGAARHVILHCSNEHSRIVKADELIPKQILKQIQAIENRAGLIVLAFCHPNSGDPILNAKDILKYCESETQTTRLTNVSLDSDDTQADDAETVEEDSRKHSDENPRTSKLLETKSKSAGSNSTLTKDKSKKKPKKFLSIELTDSDTEDSWAGGSLPTAKMVSHVDDVVSKRPKQFQSNKVIDSDSSNSDSSCSVKRNNNVLHIKDIGRKRSMKPEPEGPRKIARITGVTRPNSDDIISASSSIATVSSVAPTAPSQVQSSKGETAQPRTVLSESVLRGACSTFKKLAATAMVLPSRSTLSCDKTGSNSDDSTNEMSTTFVLTSESIDAIQDKPENIKELLHKLVDNLPSEKIASAKVAKKLLSTLQEPEGIFDKFGMLSAKPVECSRKTTAVNSSATLSSDSDQDACIVLSDSPIKSYDNSSSNIPKPVANKRFWRCRKPSSEAVKLGSKAGSVEQSSSKNEIVNKSITSNTVALSETNLVPSSKVDVFPFSKNKHRSRKRSVSSVSSNSSLAISRSSSQESCPPSKVDALPRSSPHALSRSLSTAPSKPSNRTESVFSSPQQPYKNKRSALDTSSTSSNSSPPLKLPHYQKIKRNEPNSMPQTSLQPRVTFYHKSAHEFKLLKQASDHDAVLPEIDKSTNVVEKCHTKPITYFTCHQCSFRSIEQNLFARHMFSEFQNTSEKSMGSDETSVRQQCTFCQFITYLKEEFEEHVLTHQDQNPMHYCGHCPFKTRLNRNAKRHHQNVHPTLPIDIKCRAASPSRGAYQSLKSVPVVEADVSSVIYRCSHCPFQSQWHSSIRKHQIRHHKGLPRDIQRSSSTGTQETQSASEVNTDVKFVRYHCGHCSYFNHWRSSVRKHQKLRHRGLPSNIQSRISTNKDLGTGLFYCGYCVRAFDTHSGASNHQAHHHPDRPRDIRLECPTKEIPAPNIHSSKAAFDIPQKGGRPEGVINLDPILCLRDPLRGSRRRCKRTLRRLYERNNIKSCDFYLAKGCNLEDSD